jgi:hypothetical protein
MPHRPDPLQEAIRWACRQRDIARSNGFTDVAAFWADELTTLRSRVPAKPIEQVLS